MHEEMRAHRGCPVQRPRIIQRNLGPQLIKTSSRINILNIIIIPITLITRRRDQRKGLMVEGARRKKAMIIARELMPRNPAHDIVKNLIVRFNLDTRDEL